MTRVAALGSLLSEPLTDSLVGRALSRPAEPTVADSGSRPSIEAVQEAVASAFGVSRRELLSTARTARITKARQVAMYLSRELTESSSSAIGVAFQRDHTTVLHAIRVVGAKNEPGSAVAEAIHNAREQLALPKRREGAIPGAGLDPQEPSTAGSPVTEPTAGTHPQRSTS
jgi:chromosomal replication initiator protein